VRRRIRAAGGVVAVALIIARRRNMLFLIRHSGIPALLPATRTPPATVAASSTEQEHRSTKQSTELPVLELSAIVRDIRDSCHKKGITLVMELARRMSGLVLVMAWFGA